MLAPLEFRQLVAWGLGHVDCTGQLASLLADWTPSWWISNGQLVDWDLGVVGETDSWWWLTDGRGEILDSWRISAGQLVAYDLDFWF